MKKYFPILLLLSLILILIGDQMQFESTSEVGDANHGEHRVDHSDPENNRRMGIFHFNEGNKSLRQNNPEEAVKNYKMALHHNPKFEEALVNLSTTYLQTKNYDEALNTLNSFEKINNTHPLLHYNLACYYSLTNQTERSLEALKSAVKFGFSEFGQIETDSDLKSLRDTPGYREWIRTVIREKKR